MKIGVIELLIALIVVAIVAATRRAKRKRFRKEPAPATPSAPRAVCRTVTVPDSIGDASLAYRYGGVGIFTPDDFSLDFNLIEPGLAVELACEPTNAYDSDAVAVCLDHGGFQTLGYLYRSKLRDMAADWLERLDPIHAHIESVDAAARKIELFIAFYRER